MHHPFAHLRGGLVGEGDGQDLADADVAGGQQVGDPPGEHRRLTRAGARHDEQRRTFVQHGLALLRVEAVQQVVGVSSKSHIAVKPTTAGRHFALARPLVAHSICAPSAATIFLRVPIRGARGLAASPRAPAVRIRIRGSSVV